MTYSVVDVSNFFIDYYSRSVDPVNLARVQMFVYFAQAESLVRTGEVLFEEEIRAYATGPAVARLNVYYEECGNMPISIHGDFDRAIFDKADRQLLMDVAIYYNQFSTSELQIMAYSDKGPWEQVYSQGTELLTIDPAIIRDYYMDRPGIPRYQRFVTSKVDEACGRIKTGSDVLQKDPAFVYSNSGFSKTWE